MQGALRPCYKKLSRSIQGHHLNEFGITSVPNAVYQISSTSASSFQRWRILKVFTLYGNGSHLDHVTRNIWTKFHPNIPWRLHMKFGFKRPSNVLGKEVWKCWLWVTLDKGQQTTLILGCHKSSWTPLFDYMYQLSPHRLQYFLGNLQLKHFPIQKPKGQNLTLL